MSYKAAFIFLFCAGIHIGCSKSAVNNTDRARTGGNTPAVSNTTIEKIGVPECDEFITKYEACISDHVPDAQKTQFRENMGAWQKSWRQLANQASKETLAMTCKRHILQARESMKSFNCEF